MTESEAKTKWCPMVRIANGQEGNGEAAFAAVNDVVPRIGSKANCIGSACMMWQQTSGDYGYCGLAGRPWTPK